MPDDDLPKEPADSPALRPATRRPRTRATETEPIVPDEGPDAGPDVESGEEPAGAAPTLAERLEALADHLSVPEPEPEPEPEPAPRAAPRASKKAPAVKKSAVKKPAAAKAATSVAEALAAKEQPPAKAPAKKAPAKTAPAKKAPAKKAPAKKAPAKKAPARKAGTPRVVNLDHDAGLALLEPLGPPATPVAATGGGNPGWVRALIALTVLLLAAALGMGAAALVELGPETWSSTAVVRLLPGEAPTVAQAEALKAGQGRYALQLRTTLSPIAADQAQVPTKDRRGALLAVPRSAGDLVITARAARPQEAERFATDAVDLVIAALPGDQAIVTPHEGDRLTATIASPATSATRTRPSTVRAVGLGALVATTFLLLSLAIAVRRPRG